ncbi:MAG: hypothetical protein AAB456_02595, partial [Patescibacteria group bacterium]
QGKLAPLPALLRDVYRGEDFASEKIKLPKALLDLVTPISIQNLEELLNNKDAAPVLISYILDAMGIGATTYSNKK